MNDEVQLSQLVIYIHANAVKHKLVKNITDYQWSSFHSLLSDKPTSLAREKVIGLFGDKDEFIKTHNLQTEYYYKFDD